MPTAPFDKERKKRIKNELDDLLSQYGNGEQLQDDVVNAQLQEIVAAPPIDFEEMNAGFAKKAAELTKSVFDFYLSIGLIDSHQYLKQKMMIDEGNIQNIFFQVKTLRFALEKITQEINAGSTHPRLFEVFGQLQDKLSNAVKTQANYILFLEDSYKKINNDVANRGQIENTSTAGLNAPKKDEYFVTAGTKNLVKVLDQGHIVTDFQLTENLTDPNNKSDLLEQKGLSHLKAYEEKDDDDFSDEVNSMI